MNKFEEREKAWESMSKEQQAWAYYNSVVNASRRRDAKFKKENNLANTLRAIKTQFIYGGD